VRSRKIYIIYLQPRNNWSLCLWFAKVYKKSK